MKGWVYVVNCPENWSNTAGGHNYQILDAPHVMAQNKDPKWECVECGTVVSGLGLEPGICWKCELASVFYINEIVPMTPNSRLKTIVFRG